MILGCLAILICGMHIRTMGKEGLDAQELLIHSSPNERRLSTASFGFGGTLVLNETLHKTRVAGLHCTEESSLTILVLVLHFCTFCDKELANLLTAKLSSQEQGCLALLGDLVNFGILLDQALHSCQMAFRCCPHQSRLVMLIQLVDFGTFSNEKSTDIPMSICGRLHQCRFSLFCGVVCRDAKVADQELANFVVSTQRSPHQHIPAFIILEVQGSTIICKDLHHITFPLLCCFHDCCHTLVVFHI
mmetsp:Transcript_11057/g.24244  ORF Transcript_11057/g.24244 Transcript_11057/m.24244 type:complete len:246 (+) Transcript_11057:260-997(+)